MPRANRFIQPDFIYHLTHRCHDRRSLFRFACDKSEYRRRLREALKLYRVTLLNYCLTSNHVHILVIASVTGAISRMMQKLEGDFAGHYNRRKGRSGAFWEDRFHCTMVDDEEYLENCMIYIDLNMVRAGAVAHPKDWPWCGYSELIGAKTRYRLIDMDRVVELRSESKLREFRRIYPEQVQNAIDEDRLDRERIWTESIAVGQPGFLQTIAQSIEYRRRKIEIVERPDGMCALEVSHTPTHWKRKESFLSQKSP